MVCSTFGGAGAFPPRTESPRFRTATLRSTAHAADSQPMTSPLASRAVTRLIEAGMMATCPTCEQTIKFSARVRAKQVICNVYEDGRWMRVEHYHDGCYAQAGEPYGPTDESQLLRPKRRPAAAAASAASAA
jgi:hypothetical protein